MTTPRRGTGCRLGLIGYASILRDLQLTPMTAEALSAAHGLTLDRAGKVLRSLRTVHLARVERWEERHSIGKAYRAVWAFGGAPDAPYPSPKFGRTAEACNNLSSTVITLSYLMREMVRSTRASRLVEITGSDYQLIARFLHHGADIGLCHIARYEFERGGRTAYWRLGDRPSADRPAPKSRQQIGRESNERRKVRRQQQATFHALAHQIATPFGGLLP